MDRRGVADPDHERDALRMSGSGGGYRRAERIGEKMLPRFWFDRHVAVGMSRLQFRLKPLAVDRFCTFRDMSGMAGNHRRLSMINCNSTRVPRCLEADSKEGSLWSR